MRNLIGLATAVATFFAAMQWQASQCEARWQGLAASYTLLTGCMVEVDLLKVPEGSVSVPAERPRIHANFVR
jgi:hypothetical protein